MLTWIRSNLSKKYGSLRKSNEKKMGGNMKSYSIEWARALRRLLLSLASTNFEPEAVVPDVHPQVPEAAAESAWSLSHPHLLPPGSWDTHVHVFDSILGPFAPTRAYTPGEATLQELLNFTNSLSAKPDSTSSSHNIVLVQPSPYKTDNTVLLQLLRQLGSSEGGNGITARGIAVVDLDRTTNEELCAMHLLGVRGLRLNLQADGLKIDVEALRRTLERAAARFMGDALLSGWKLQVFAPACVWEDLHETILNLPVCLILDHLGGLKAPSRLVDDENESENNKNKNDTLDPLAQPGLDAMLDLARKKRVYIKVSGMYRASSDSLAETGFADLEPIVRLLVKKVPDRLIWGSDWPHTGEPSGRRRSGGCGLDVIEPFRVVDNDLVMKNLREWVGDDKVWRQMLIETPEEVYR